VHRERTSRSPGEEQMSLKSKQKKTKMQRRIKHRLRKKKLKARIAELRAGKASA
jgi:hypothetical protein